MIDQEYYSVTLEVVGDAECDRVIKLARGMSYYRIYIDETADVSWSDECEYQIEVVFNNEHDVTMFNLKL